MASCTVFSARSVNGWSNGGYSTDPSNPVYGTHDWIAQHALDWLPGNEKQYLLDNLASYLYGTELPDNSQAPDGIGDIAKHHIYYWSNGSLQDGAAAIRADEEFQIALTFLEARDYANAAKTAGIMSHYIVDPGVWAHVMGASTDWGSETGNNHSNYESYVNGRTSNYTDTFNHYLSFNGSLSMISAGNAAKGLAYDATFDHGGIFTCVWMNNNYNVSNPIYWDRAGESLNLAVNYLTEVLHTLYIDSEPSFGPTQVSGVIASDTTWGTSGSPYNLTGNTLVSKGVTLTILPGVSVNLNGYYIMVNGTLNATGNSANPIAFNNGQVSFTKYCNAWNENTGMGCIIAYATLSSSLSSLYPLYLSNLVKIANDTIRTCDGKSTAIIVAREASVNPPIIFNNVIYGGISVSQDSCALISNNNIFGGIGVTLLDPIYGGGNSTIVGNTISKSSIGIAIEIDKSTLQTVLIEKNLIINNNEGIEIYQDRGPVNSPIILDNTITNNTIGIYLKAVISQSISNNNIYNNSNYNIKNEGGNVDATYNWWGTTDAQAISQTIYDFKNNFIWGTVSFVSFLTLPNNQAPVFIAASAGNGGLMNPNGIIYLNCGDNQTFNVAANAGYQIADVLVDGSSVGACNSYAFSNVTAQHSIVANFVIYNYVITVAQGANGVISPGTTVVSYGSSQNFIITPNTGYHVVDVAVDGVSRGVLTSYSFNNVQVPHSITTTFAINTYTVTVTAGANGQITPSTGSANYSATPTYTITPNTDYHIASITVNGQSVTVTSPVGQTYQFSPVSNNASIGATFAVNTCAITVTQSANGLITGPSSVNYGSDAVYSIAASAGCHIVDVWVDGSSKGPVTSYTISNVQTTHTITASFASDPTPTPTPVPTDAPTQSPTSTSTPTSTPLIFSPTTSPLTTPSVPEFPLVAFTLIVLLAISTAILFIARKSRR